MGKAATELLAQKAVTNLYVQVCVYVCVSVPQTRFFLLLFSQVIARDLYVVEER